MRDTFRIKFPQVKAYQWDGTEDGAKRILTAMMTDGYRADAMMADGYRSDAVGSMYLEISVSSLAYSYRMMMGETDYLVVFPGTEVAEVYSQSAFETLYEKVDTTLCADKVVEDALNEIQEESDESIMRTRQEHINALRDWVNVKSGEGFALFSDAVDWAIEQGMPVAPEPKVRIKRGDVIESPKDAERYEVPNKTAFRDQHGSVREYNDKYTDALDAWVQNGFPLRCIDVPGEPVTEQKRRLSL